MGVLAYKIVDLGGGNVASFKQEFECGVFDLADESGGLDGWVEIARDCDRWPSTRRTLTPYASGNKGASDFISTFDDKIRFRKYFPNTTDAELDVLDLSDMNGGVLPAMVWIDLYQNGKQIPTPEACTVDYDTAELTILAEWRVPGAAYEVIFQSQLVA